MVLAVLLDSENLEARQDRYPAPQKMLRELVELCQERRLIFQYRDLKDQEALLRFQVGLEGDFDAHLDGQLKWTLRQNTHSERLDDPGDAVPLTGDAVPLSKLLELEIGEMYRQEVLPTAGAWEINSSEDFRQALRDRCRGRTSIQVLDRYLLRRESASFESRLLHLAVVIDAINQLRDDSCPSYVTFYSEPLLHKLEFIQREGRQTSRKTSLSDNKKALGAMYKDYRTKEEEPADEEVLKLHSQIQDELKPKFKIEFFDCSSAKNRMMHDRLLTADSSCHVFSAGFSLVDTSSRKGHANLRDRLDAVSGRRFQQAVVVEINKMPGNAYDKPRQIR